MSLSKLQREFTKAHAELVSWAFANGFELTDGDAYRDPRVHGALGERKGYGHSSSCHKLRLARDYNLFIGGDYQTSSEAHRPLGDKWKSLHPLARWGGDFKKPDGNHYSFEYNGNL